MLPFLHQPFPLFYQPLPFYGKILKHAFLGGKSEKLNPPLYKGRTMKSQRRPSFFIVIYIDNKGQHLY